MNTAQSITSNIFLHGLELKVFLGWTEEERAQAQTVIIDIKIRFPEPPLACLTDNLSDTLCYDQLTQTLTAHLSDRAFNLLEHLAQEVYLLIKKSLLNQPFISIRINKKPAIANLMGGASFSYGDEDWAW